MRYQTALTGNRRPPAALHSESHMHSLSSRTQAQKCEGPIIRTIAVRERRPSCRWRRVVVGQANRSRSVAGRVSRLRNDACHGTKNAGRDQLDSFVMSEWLEDTGIAHDPGSSSGDVGRLVKMHAQNAQGAMGGRALNHIGYVQVYLAPPLPLARSLAPLHPEIEDGEEGFPFPLCHGGDVSPRISRRIPRDEIGYT